MRLSMIWVGLGLCGLVAGTGCADVKKVETEAAADTKGVDPSHLKDDLNAIKKGDIKTVGDDAVSVQVKNALGKDAKTKGANFNVAVKGGVVTLTGSGSADSKAQAEHLAKGVTGVSSVTNQITAK
jgi:osmotically-inducible protein OsmY